MKHKISSEIDIQASVEVVWEILMDLDKYRDWNPFIISSKGIPKIGEKLKNRIQPPGGKAMTFNPVVTKLNKNHVFEWKGELLVPGVFTGYHRFELSQEGNVTHLIHSESFSGLLVRFMKKSLDNGTADGFKAMNEALKVRAEAKN